LLKTTQHDHPSVRSKIKITLTSLQAASVRLDLSSIRGVMIGIITSHAPQMFKVIVMQKVHGKYLWDHFQCRDSFVGKFLRTEMKWTLRRSTRPGKKTPDNIQQILSDTFFRLVWAISNFNILPMFLVNSDQTMVYYSAGAIETYAPVGSKQVEVLGKDERRGFTLMVVSGRHNLLSCLLTLSHERAGRGEQIYPLNRTNQLIREQIT